MPKRVIQLVGWYGTVAILCAYALSSFNVLSTQSFFYQLLNITGAFGIIVISLKKKVYQSVVLNLVWAGIGFMVILKLLLNN